MSSDQSEAEKILLQSIEETTKTPQSSSKYHLPSTPSCAKEVEQLNNSLSIFLQVERRNEEKLPPIDLWDSLQKKITHESKQHTFWKKQKIPMMAAVIATIIGLSTWLQIQTPEESLLSQHTVIPIASGQTFGEPQSQKELIWTDEHFGLSIKDTQQGGESQISISMQLTKQYTQIIPTPPSQQTERRFSHVEHENMWLVLR